MKIIVLSLALLSSMPAAAESFWMLTGTTTTGIEFFVSRLTWDQCHLGGQRAFWTPWMGPITVQGRETHPRASSVVCLPYDQASSIYSQGIGK